MSSAAEMTAARWLARRRVELARVAVPAPRPDEALVAVEWVGLCGSDAEEYTDGPIVVTPPITLGHEIVGIVARSASDGSGPSVGTRVVVDVVTGCGHCYWCLRHEEGLCPDLVVTGQHVDGGLAEYVVGRASRLLPVPPSLDARSAALAEPLSVAVRAVRKAGALQGAGVLVIGGGTIGLLTAQVALAAGADPVVVIEPSPDRRALAAGWGAVPVWEPSAETRRDVFGEVFPERGIDVVFECSGRAGMVAEAVTLTRRGGTAILLSVLAAAEPIDTLDLLLGEKIVRGSAAHLWDDDVAVAVDMLARGAVDVAPLITHTMPIERVVDAFETLVDPRQNVIKLLIEVGPAANTAHLAASSPTAAPATDSPTAASPTATTSTEKKA